MTPQNTFDFYSAILTAVLLVICIGAQLYVGVGHVQDNGVIGLVTKAVLAAYLSGRGVQHYLIAAGTKG